MRRKSSSAKKKGEGLAAFPFVHDRVF